MYLSYLWLGTIGIFVLSIEDLSEANGQCNAKHQCGGEESSKFKALIGHTFKTLLTRNPEECHERCQDDIRCQSLNFVIRSGLCELNNRNKESKPKCLIHDMERFYLKRWPKGVILGSVPQLPADSCEDINLSEDGKVASGIYWLDPARSGNVSKVHCDMTGLGAIEDSAILSRNITMKQTFINTLASYLGSVFQSGRIAWKKCYQATANDWESTTFHFRCNFKGPTITIVRFGNYIFGGYTSIPWKGVYGRSCGYKQDTKAFLFTLNNTHGFYPEKLAITRSVYAIYDCYSTSPTFGGGYDIRLRNRQSYSSVYCHSYTCPKYQFVSPTSFKPSEVEVFYKTAPSETIDDSAILSNNETMKRTYLDKLASYLAPVLQSVSSEWKKCYQATVDGWDSNDFHYRCNYKGPTVTIIRFGNYIFGGYTSKSWQGFYGLSCTYRDDAKAFLFTLHNTNGYYPEKLPIKRSSYGIYDCYIYGPIFGAGHDIKLYLKYTSYVSCHSYTCPKYQFVQPTSFKANEVEIFYETTPPETIEDSAILSANETMKQTYLDKLGSYLAPVLQAGSSGWKKCYQATVHGWETRAFHFKCNYKGPTVTIIRFGNYIFGGYTSKSWQGVRGRSCGYKSDTKAFLFTLHNTYGFYPEKLAIKRTYNAIYDCYSYSPTFGGGHDIRLYNQRYNSYVSCYSYTCPKYQFVSPTSFKPNEVEVFYETTN